MYDIPAVIFAGGKSSRMGQDKALLPFGESKSMSHYQYQKLHPLFKSVYLSAKSNKFNFASMVIEDNYSESSPLVGLISTFETLEDDAIFVLSVDAPMVDKVSIDKLMQVYYAHPEKDAIIAKSPKGVQPLCGIYSRDVLGIARQHYTRHNHKMLSLLHVVNTLEVDFEDEAPFVNLNTPQEYQSTASLNQ